MGYADSPRRDQVRQGEVVKVAVFKTTRGTLPEPEALGPVGIALAGLALEKAIGFASDELQKHLEKVASLHEAGYQGRAVIPDFDPTANYEIHILRYVSHSESNPEQAELAMRSVYRLSPAKVVSSSAVVVVTFPARDDSFDQHSTFEHAAVRLADTREPFHLDTTLRFYTAADAAKEPSAGVKDSPPAKEPKPVRQQVGETMIHRRMIRLDGGPTLPAMTLSKRGTKIHDAVSADDSLGFLVLGKHRQILEVEIAVTEKDPSRAADRNRAVQQNLKDLTPQFIEYVKDLANLKDPAGSK